jgi:ferredoxin
VGPFPASFDSTEPSRPKTYYKYDPFDKIVRRHEETQNKSEECEDGRGDAAGAVPGCPFDSINTISFITMIKRE